MTNISRSFAIIMFVFLFNSLAEANDIQRRKDVQDKLQQVLCVDKIQLDAQKTIALGIYDAQIDARIIESIAGNALSGRMLEKKSKALAAMKRYNGYAHGVCSDRKGWVAAFPAPSPLIRTKTGFKVQFKTLETACRNYRLDFASLSGGESQPLTKASVLNTQSLGAGMLEITCQPSFPRWQGPIVWYLAPTDADASLTGNAPAIEGNAAPTAGIISWISTVRKKQGLAPITINDKVSKSAELLTIDTSVTHNRASTDSLKEKIKNTDNIKILGELRVRGQSAADLTWMIWQSPRHRDLILSREATLYGLHVKQVGTELLVVFLAGQEQRPVTASAGKKKTSAN